MMEPLIPLKIAERLYVAMGVVIQEIQKKSDYPTDTLDLIVHHYEISRSNYLKGKGWQEKSIKDVTQTEVFELHKWLIDRAAESKVSAEDLELWEREMDDHP
ncbi:MAG: hypothetical protein A4E20_11030 [Nitrospira sp. SG-bin2]|uniref:hypothetical protein n=1 Tax=Nitrospira cf. moscoviensis SBR1015 TaxID=96242 RepID=UPI000A0C3A73|nr:hypothetical protein [Nitrospira cf. moscoviensis SBR1015]OQW34546.1 MAG: hypothetical protein A4E20_11030 [Nitrospira sp. SG-bin2]